MSRNSRTVLVFIFFIDIEAMDFHPCGQFQDNQLYLHKSQTSVSFFVSRDFPLSSQYLHDIVGFQSGPVCRMRQFLMMSQKVSKQCCQQRCKQVCTSFHGGRGSVEFYSCVFVLNFRYTRALPYILFLKRKK